jgi:hypothetical protein
MATGMGDSLLMVLAAPRAALSRLAATQPVGLAVFVLVFSQTSASIATHLALKGTGSGAAILDAFFMGILTLVCAVLGAAFFHMYATLYGGRGEPAQLFWALIVGDAPWLLATPGLLIVLAAGERSPRWYLPLLFVLMVGLAIWVIGVKAFWIALLYGISGGRALFVFFVGYGTVVALALATAFAAPMAWFNWALFLLTRTSG